MKLESALPNISQAPAMTRFQWFYIKRLMGKPRRFSPRFIMQEQQLLHRQVRHGEPTHAGETGLRAQV